MVLACRARRRHIHASESIRSPQVPCDRPAPGDEQLTALSDPCDRPEQESPYENFNHPITADLAQANFGFLPLPGAPGGMALDYIRGNLFDASQMKPIPLSGSGPDDDLNEKLERH